MHHGETLYHQPRALALGLGMPAVVFSPYGNVVEVVSRDQGGIALLSRWPLVDVRHRRLPSGHLEANDARVALFATVAAPDGPLAIGTTHLSWGGRKSATCVSYKWAWS